ncbi:MAG: tryptophan 2,3-dioxygenase family protein [Bacteroidota bacterium]|jgi:tryptophan 2,3-dioxygenase
MEKNIAEKVALLQKKFEAMGQDLSSYLEGLLHADYLTYWDYIHLDTLLTLQQPKTAFPDEKIFIVYHQITELYFNLCLHELKQICLDHPGFDIDFFNARLTRVIRYFHALTHSFGIMVDGMEKDQFLNFRMSLLPASGFQSMQYRLIEIHATPFSQLVAADKREQLRHQSLEHQFEEIYWKYGATELASGKKTLTLQQFEEKYNDHLIQEAKRCSGNTVWDVFGKIQAERNHPETISLLRDLDVQVNINWPLMHYKSAVRYLHKNPESIAATGGTNWQKYLPPRFQRRNFYPELWTNQELTEWGKSWVETSTGIKFP